MDLTFLALLPGFLIWFSILILPWRPWSTRESLDSQTNYQTDLSDITVLIPARNEALTIATILSALKNQSNDLNIILIDDQSTDNTIDSAKQVSIKNLSIINGTELPNGWTGKLWALEQGRQYVKTKYLVLLDADIVLAKGLIPSILKKAKEENLQMISLMAFLKMETVWEKLLMPAFIFFFKLLYPFHLANKPRSQIAAAAGGFIFIETAILKKLGGFKCIKHALIDDCCLAKQIKQKGYRTWMGLTHSAVSIRNYQTLTAIWHMVTRTAYTQLYYSPWLLLLCTVLMLAAFGLPLLALLIPSTMSVIGLITLGIQGICYLPILRYYSIPLIYAISLPLVACLYLIMTWHSAYQHYYGNGVIWKDRYYN